jgi:lipoprotein-anchoring transpeptidase ErfK/SrfK
VLAASAAALVAVAAVMLTGTGDRADATAVAAGALPAGLPAVAAADLDGAATAPVSASETADTADTADPVAIPAVRTVASSRQQGVRQGTSPETATNAPRATARPTAAAAAATTVDGTPCTSTAKACVDVADRQAWLIDKGVVTRGPVQVMTGDNDDPTPLGTFHVQWKAEQYTSRQYLTQMPYSVFFADGGVAFHEGPQDTYSAGCVKLVHADAVAWFNYLQVGDEVQVR